MPEINTHLFTFSSDKLKKFIIRLIFLFIPFIGIATSYFIYDPFFVLYDHGDTYFVENGTPDAYTLNRDFVATEFILRYGKEEKFNSFILGSSRASAFMTNDWKKRLNQSANVFHYNCDNETLYGLANKLKLLKALDLELSNLLIVIDHQLLNRSHENRAPRERYHYEQTKSLYKFHYNYFKDYLGSNFFIQYLTYKSFDRKYSWMDKLFENDKEFRRMKYSKIDMQWIFHGDNLALSENEDSLYNKRIHLFNSVDKKVTHDLPVILDSKEKIEILNQISDIINDSGGEYKIVISPLYDKLTLHKKDLQFLYDIFGTENVFDFSGRNNITANYRNYYEPSHYRPHIGKLILDNIYTSNF